MKIKINNNTMTIIKCQNFFQKLKGLMFKKKPITKGYYFKNCNSIHTFFMKQNIDICMIDKTKKIVLLKANIPKNKIIICKKAKHTLELPLNTVKHLNINQHLKIGD